MGAIGQYQLKPFSRPVRPLNEFTGPDQIRGNDNQTAKAFNSHDADASIHLVTTTTTGVTTSAVAIYAAITNSAVAWVNGDDGAGKAFVDQVAWNGGGSATAVSSTTTKGAPAARTYSIASGVLKLLMGSGTYTIQVVPIVFT